MNRLGLTLLFATGCFEHFERLETTVTYDPDTQRFAIERRLVDVSAALLDCSTAETCVGALDRAIDPRRIRHDDRLAPSDQLAARLFESGAENVQVTFEPDRDGSLDIVVTYDAGVGTSATDETGVYVEWRSTGRRGRGRHHLVVEAEATDQPLDRVQTRKRPRSTDDGVEWVVTWELPARRRTVDLSLSVGQGGRIFDEVPGLRAAMVERGWLATTVTRRVVASGAASVAAERAATTSTVGTVQTDPAAGATLTVGDSRRALDPLLPALDACYRARQAERPDLQGDAIISATVAGSGTVTRSSVSGPIGDVPLLDCLADVLTSWRFDPWGPADQSAEVSVPLVFRVANP